MIKKTLYRVVHLGLKLSVPLIPYKKVYCYKGIENVCKILQDKNLNNVFIVTDKILCQTPLFELLIKELADCNIQYTICNKVEPNPSVISVESATKEYKNNNCKCLLSFGGGSSIDVAKAVGACLAKKKPLTKMKGLFKILKVTVPHICIPTTAGSGSEVTLTSVLTDENHVKFTINDPCLIPKYSVLDYRVLLTVPNSVLAQTGMDALTHAIEAIIGKCTTKNSRKNSLEAIKIIFENLELAYKTKDVNALDNMLYASHIAGKAFSRSFVGYVHSIAHTLGGEYNTPHGLANAVILPIVLKEYGDSIDNKVYKITKYLGWESGNKREATKMFIEKIENLNKSLNIDSNLIFIRDEDISKLANLAHKEANPLYPVPKIFLQKDIENIIKIIKGDVNG